MKNITIKSTPNPETLQIIFPQIISKEPLEFKLPNEPHSPLLKTLLGFPWVKHILVSQNFISLTKEDWVEWESLKPALLDLISEYQNQPLTEKKSDIDLTDKDLDPQAEKIKHIIDTEIQPAVQLDGGFIQFSHYKNGIVYVKLKGACVGCPSAEWTLKQGIEARIQKDFPEVKEVISID